MMVSAQGTAAHNADLEKREKEGQGNEYKRQVGLYKAKVNIHVIWNFRETVLSSHLCNALLVYPDRSTSCKYLVNSSLPWGRRNTHFKKISTTLSMFCNKHLFFADVDLVNNCAYNIPFGTLPEIIHFLYD